MKWLLQDTVDSYHSAFHTLRTDLFKALDKMNCEIRADMKKHYDLVMESNALLMSKVDSVAADLEAIRSHLNAREGHAEEPFISVRINEINISLFV